MKSGNVFSSIVLSAAFLMLLWSCGGTRGMDDETRFENFRSLTEYISSRNFEIENEWAIPIRGNRINLIDNPNHIKVRGDSVEIYLPYFGVRHIGGGYGQREGGIVFEGLAENLEVVEDPDNRNVVLKFQGEQGNEDLQFFITIFPNGRTNTTVSSSQRDAITYRGSLERGRDNRR